uniref:Copper transporter n=1 Tax=Heterorhabditis bacteriophora TaxID=37862 RepID=A0A1I7W861_HETBA
MSMKAALLGGEPLPCERFCDHIVFTADPYRRLFAYSSLSDSAIGWIVLMASIAFIVFYLIEIFYKTICLIKRSLTTKLFLIFIVKYSATNIGFETILLFEVLA